MPAGINLDRFLIIRQIQNLKSNFGRQLSAGEVDPAATQNGRVAILQKTGLGLPQSLKKKLWNGKPHARLSASAVPEEHGM